MNNKSQLFLVVSASDIENKTRVRFYICHETRPNKKTFIKQYMSNLRRHDIMMKNEEERNIIMSLTQYLKDFYKCDRVESFLDKRLEYIKRIEKKNAEKRKKTERESEANIKSQVSDDIRIKRAREYNTNKVRKYRYVKQATGLNMQEFNMLPEGLAEDILSYGGFNDSGGRFVVNEKNVDKSIVRTKENIVDEIIDEENISEKDEFVMLLKRKAISNFMKFKGMPDHAKIPFQKK